MERKTEKLIKSKDRVANFGEVYTKEREIEAMLDLVKIDSSRIESRFLEPACGNGNFLLKILDRKLKVVRKRYKSSQYEFEQYLFLSVSSIYGIDILRDNVREAKDRMLLYIKKQYRETMKVEMSNDLEESIKYLLNKNIICGDGLSGLKSGAEAEPVMFSEWTMMGSFVKRKDFAMGDMIAYQEITNEKNNILSPRREFERVSYKEVYKLG